MATDLARALVTLADKQNKLNRLWNYYDGLQPMVYANERLREVLHRANAQFVENWAAVVVDSVHDRINLNGFDIEDEAQQQVLRDLFERCEMGILADDVHEGALVLGEAYVIVWPNSDGLPWPYYNDARLCQVFYDANEPYRVSYAAKWWMDEDARRRLTLYYPDRLEHYQGGKDSTRDSQFIPDAETPVEPNPYGVVPVFRFTQKRTAKSDIENILPLQDAVNKLLSDMMRAAEVSAYRQRWIISDSDTARLINAPNEVWNIPGGVEGGQPSQVGEFSQTELGNFLEAIDRLAAAVGIISRTPRHYFYGQAGTPSGEALIAMEAPLNKKARDYQERYGSTWRQVAAFMLRLAGAAQAEAQNITPRWDTIETVQPYTLAQTRQLGTAAGIPLVTLLRREGWSQAELDQLEQDLAEANTAKQQTLANALVDAQRQFAAGEGAE